MTLIFILVNLVQLAGKLDPNFFASVLRCLGNLALRKECAVGILQSPYHAVDTIIERMASSETSLKVQNLSLRFLSSFTLNGLSFASFLLKKRAVSALGKMFLSPTSTDAMKVKFTRFFLQQGSWSVLM